MSISFYNERGEFTSSLTGDNAGIELTKELTEDSWVEGDWYGKPYYALDGEAVERAECPAVLTGLILTELPVPCVIDINGTKYDSDDATVELDLGTGAHKITIIAWPYLDGVFNVKN